MTKAFAIYYNSEKKRFVLDTIDYDPESGHGQLDVREDGGDSRAMALFNTEKTLTKFIMNIPMIKETKK